ncbi:uncharacterized protein CDAR_543651 [Caerostris darwini]|uniref:Reverse transcriptase domain-containing protein n=1 Tax=Caerostris darwini TaxID=1538125 RepID=A0AAV4V1X0_9ARAC|nr:uncharacterized protein CDAR_543651 [Caerostris darwini]
MEQSTSDMDNMLEELLPKEGLLRGITIDANETMQVALGHYKNILNLSDKKEIRTDTRAAFRENAMALISLFSSQTVKMAQLQGRLIELEKIKDTLNNVQPQSYAPIAKATSKTASKQIERPRSKSRPRQQKFFLTMIKPVEITTESTSLNTKRTIQKQIDVKNLPPTFDCSRGQSWTDLILSKNLNHDLALEVSDDIFNSYHRLLQLTWEQEKIESTQKKKIKFNHSNWLDIKQAIFKIINNNSHLELHSLQQQIDTIQKEIFDKTSYAPNNNRKPNKRNAVWWTLELKIKRSKTRALRRLYKKESNDNIRNIKKEAFKKSESEYKKLIIHTKTIKFKEIINKITTNNCFGRNFDIIATRKKRAEALKPILKQDGSSTASIQESHEAILQFHFPLLDCREFLIDQNIPDSNFVAITIGELESVINNIKPNKAVGIDGIPGEVIKEIYLANPKCFLRLLNILLERGEFPRIWKIARVVLIPKEDRDLSQPRDYRPICILPCWGKILDKIVSERLSFFLEKTILHPLQFGFRKKRSTANALHNIKCFINEAHERRHVTCLVSLDVAKAFNTEKVQSRYPTGLMPRPDPVEPFYKRPSLPGLRPKFNYPSLCG